MKRSLAAALFMALPAVVEAQLLDPQEVRVEAVQIQQNRLIPAESLLYYISTKPGDAYDEKRLREDFRHLWETGFLDDLYLDVRDGRTGKIVTFVVVERKRVQIVDYRGNKSVSNTDIEDKLKEKELALRLDSFYDLGKARKVEAVVKEMLAEKGRPFAKVTHNVKPIGTSGAQISFVVDEGPKIRVKDITFAGNQVASDRRLRRAMKGIKQRRFWNLSWILGKTTYTEEKWREAQESVRDFYLKRGYATATVGEPTLEYFAEKEGEPQKWIRMDIPVTEGDRYTVGKIEFEGLTVFREEGIRTLFKLQPGDVYDDSKLKKGYEKLRDLYGSQGYFQWTGFTKRKPDPEKKVVDLVLSMEEDKRYFVGRIAFTGNSTTRDKVIRREVYMNEGEVFNTEALKLSIKKINQLGYFKPLEAPPEVAPSKEEETKLDVTFKVEEQNRNQLTFGGGVSGLEGTFLNASFATSNFLGLGETFQVSAQSGRRTKNYQLSITEPYLKDRPITAGIDIYKRKIQYQTYASQGIQGYVDDRTGGGVTVGFPLGRFTRAYTGYSYEVVEISEGDTVDTSLYDPTQPLINRYFLEDVGKRYESRLTPSVVHSTVDNPWTPRSGKKLSATLQVAGGPLQGTLDYFRPDLEAIFYVPHTRRTALGVRAEVAWILPFGRTARIDPTSGRNGLPFYQRYLLGGETQIRGFDVRSVGPLDSSNLPAANKFALFNAEYYIDIVGPLRGLLFFDAGQAFAEGEPFSTTGIRTSTGAEVRFIMPVLNVPFRLIYAYNPNRGENEPKKGFKFAVGTTF